LKKGILITDVTGVANISFHNLEFPINTDRAEVSVEKAHHAGLI